MNNYNQDFEPTKILNSFLEEKGLRKTQERYLILEEIYKTNNHFDNLLKNNLMIFLSF